MGVRTCSDVSLIGVMWGLEKIFMSIECWIGCLVENFQSNNPVHPSMSRPVHDAHAATADWVEEQVIPQNKILPLSLQDLGRLIPRDQTCFYKLPDGLA